MSWTVIFLGSLVLYLSLFGIVRGASRTQLALERALREYSEQLEREVEARTREVQRKAEEWERTIDAVPELIAILDRTGRIVRCNKALAAKLGTTPDRVIGEKCYQVLHGREAPWPTCPLPRTFQTGAPRLPKSRTRTWAAPSSSPAPPSWKKGSSSAPSTSPGT